MLCVGLAQRDIVAARRAMARFVARHADLMV
jgi:hypothetical protein